MSESRKSAMLLAALLGAAFCGFFTSCLDLREGAAPAAQNPCTTCHGSEDNPGNELLRSSPPRDLYGNTGTAYPGVGAHALHLIGSDTHAAVACSECHRVPESVNEPGHADTDRPAELFFGALAKTRGHAPEYDSATRRCSDSYCHNEYKPVWTHPKSDSDTCGTCHALPPPAPHPASEQCAVCHGEVVNSAQQIIAPDKHVDGTVQATEASCSDCHGSSENAAPPQDLEGNTSRASIGVGAHQAHLSGGDSGRSLACSECHNVPETPISEGHLDGDAAQVVFTDTALAHDRNPAWDRETTSCSDTWCHSPGQHPAMQPALDWTEEYNGLPCNGCHDDRPPAPHPAAGACAECHAGIVSDDGTTILDRDRHVNGVVDVDISNSCTSCHGDVNAAPPLDLAGNQDANAPGVGAHQAHLLANGRARPLECAECHRVPNATLAVGHVDSPPPAEVQFKGVALSFNANPKYEDGSCQESFCHSASIAGRFAGGTQVAPLWTTVDGSASQCTSCHAMPPPAPHPANADDCSSCHHNIAADRSFIVPERHVDGIVTFYLSPQGL